MMDRIKANPKIPEGINSSQEHPLKEFFLLIFAVLLLLSLAVVSLSYVTGSLVHYVPFSYEQKLTQWYEKTLDKETVSGEAKGDVYLHAEQAVAELGLKMAEQMDLPDGITLHIHLIEMDDTPNAFATLGGHIFITSALLKHIESENALAMVLAHEIGHIKQRHPLASLGQGVLFQIVFGLLTGSQDSRVLSSVLGEAGLLTMLGFSRAMERESDAEAIVALQAFYGHLNGADGFLRYMANQREQAAWQEMFQTHPNIEERIQEMMDASAVVADVHRMPAVLDERIQHYLREKPSN